jgi:hypothetical protein
VAHVKYFHATFPPTLIGLFSVPLMPYMPIFLFDLFKEVCVFPHPTYRGVRWKLRGTLDGVHGPRTCGRIWSNLRYIEPWLNPWTGPFLGLYLPKWFSKDKISFQIHLLVLIISVSFQNDAMHVGDISLCPFLVLDRHLKVFGPICWTGIVFLLLSDTMWVCTPYENLHNLCKITRVSIWFRMVFTT